ncbi:restriction endonuclease subunit S [Rhodococcus ruber]|nr:restriction endonuclease subunit S [Rhodococcus ruber]MCF8785321.1 restriction endonuclease subunit S [Rhodococcus ruber]
MTSDRFEFRPLGDVGVQVLDCEHRTPSDAGEGYAYIAIPNVRDGRLDLTECRRITPQDYVEWTRRTRPIAGDVVLTRRARVGDTAVIPVGLDCAIGQNLVLLRSDGMKVHQRFLRWATRSPLWRMEIDRLGNVGAVFDSLNVRDVPKLRIPVPPLVQQEAISDVLGALDDKLAANRSLARAADALAHKYFQAIAHRALGRKIAYGDIANVGGGGTPKTSVPEYWGGPIPWATPTDITALDVPSLGETARSITEQGLANSSANLYPAGSILMTSRATIGAFAIAERPLAVNQGFIVVNAKDPVLQWWLYHDMRSRVEEFVAHANGATFLELPRGRFKTMTVNVPGDAVIQEFSAQAAGLHKVASVASGETRTLAALRDTLLPRLMSGELRVRDAEAVVADAV